MHIFLKSIFHTPEWLFFLSTYALNRTFSQSHSSFVLCFLSFEFDRPYLQQGTSKCLRCGQNTKSTKNKDGCDPMGCKFSPKGDVHYDLSMLSRPGGPMFRVIPSELKATKIRGSKTRTARDSPPFIREFYINLCTVNHDNTSCLIRDLTSKDPLKSVCQYIYLILFVSCVNWI